ncbi:MAG: GAF domain-containing protein [Pseudomonadales bacterium]
MEAPRIPINEKERLETLLRLKILDTPSEDRYDRYTRICTRLFDTPIAVISLVDKYRQWFKSTCGIDAKETSRKFSFCAHAILDDDILEVPDALLDGRFRDNPLVTDMPNIRFYAGAPLKTPNGHNIGTLCIIDKTPRQLNEDQKVMLRNLADMVVDDIVRYVDLSTGLDNRVALINAGNYAFGRARPDKRFYLTLLDMSAVIETQENAEAKNAWRDKFVAQMQDLFAHAVSIAHLGDDHYCILHEQHHALCDIETLHHIFAHTDLRLQSEPVYVDRIPLQASEFVAMEDLLRRVDALFFADKRNLLPKIDKRH